MSNISISRPHAMTRDEAVRMANEVAEELAARYGLATRWQGDIVHISGRGLAGRLQLTADEIHLDVELGFLVALFRESILAGIDARLDALLQAAPPRPKRARKKAPPSRVARNRSGAASRRAKPS